MNDARNDAIKKKEQRDMWLASIGIWRGAAGVTNFMRDEIGGLRDANGEPLPNEAKQFLLDLLFCRIKPRKGRHLPKDNIRERYGFLLCLEQNGLRTTTSSRLRGDSPSDAIKKELADEFRTSVATIDQIVHPRPSRQPRKRRKS